MLNLNTIRTMEDIDAFLKAMNVISFNTKAAREEKAKWIRVRLIQFGYRNLGKKQRGLIRKYLKKVTNYSGAQLTRHVNAYRVGKRLNKPSNRNIFKVKYTSDDEELLAETDNLHRRINGAATVKICEAMFERGDERYKSLAKISVSHLYRLRKRSRYRERVLRQEKTKAVQRAIGERRKPEPKGKPGFIRVDSVHQGDKDKEKGVYHINLVDEVLQWEVIISVCGISEHFLLPALKQALSLFPFKLMNFHSDNGSEYINKTVARLLNKLLITQTKSRPRRSNDNGLVESKNGAIIRKHMGHAHISRDFAARISQFYENHLIPYINFHRPCAFPKIELFSNGKKKIRYPYEDYMTPYQKLLSLKNPEQYLKEGFSLKQLEQQVLAKTPNEAANDLHQALHKLKVVIISSRSMI